MTTVKSRGTVTIDGQQVPVDAQPDHVGQRHGTQVGNPLLRFDSCQLQKVAHQLVEAFGLLVDRLQEPDAYIEIVEGAVEQSLDASLDGRQRGLELVRGVGDELLPHLFEPP